MAASSLRVLVAIVACLSLLMSGPPSTAAHPSSLNDQGDNDPIVHRYVWDQVIPGRRGIHLRSAELDGSNETPLYDSRRGWTLELTMDRAGRRVAFSPCCRADQPSLVVVDITNNEVLEPLVAHPKIDSVGGIGWSPSGRRIAFEGFSGRYPHRHARIWTIRPDGTGLRQVLHLFNTATETYYNNDALAWTSDGILYSDNKDLRAAWKGESQMVLPRARSVRISGDGLSIVTTRLGRGGHRWVWFGNSDGTDQRRLFRNEPGGTWYRDVTPSYDGQTLSAVRDSPTVEGDQYSVVTWPVDTDPAAATIIDLADSSYLFTWN